MKLTVGKKEGTTSDATSVKNNQGSRKGRKTSETHRIESWRQTIPGVGGV